MNVRQKIYAAAGIWFVLIFGLAVISGAISQYFIIPLIALHLGIGAYICTRRCPTCHKAVLNNPITIFGTKIFIWTVKVPDNCSKCGTKLIP